MHHLPGITGRLNRALALSKSIAEEADRRATRLTEDDGRPHLVTVIAGRAALRAGLCSVAYAIGAVPPDDTGVPLHGVRGLEAQFDSLHRELVLLRSDVGGSARVVEALDAAWSGLRALRAGASGFRFDPDAVVLGQREAS
jgi:hypothetical protein